MRRDQGHAGPADGRARAGPPQPAPADHSDIDSDCIERALVYLRGSREGWHKSALHRLMAKDDEADARVQPAPKRAGLSPTLSRRLSPGAERSQTRYSKGDDQRYYPHRCDAT